MRRGGEETRVGVGGNSRRMDVQRGKGKEDKEDKRGGENGVETKNKREMTRQEKGDETRAEEGKEGRTGKEKMNATFIKNKNR